MNEIELQEDQEQNPTKEAVALMLPVPDYLQVIARATALLPKQVSAVLELTEEGGTVPFIARYRKERTGNLDENEIRSILDTKKSEENLYKAKLTALGGIYDQGLLTEELKQNIIAAKTQKEVDDIYTPFRLKRKTKAMLALEKGFGVVAELIKKNVPYAIPEELLASYPREEIVEGAIEIIAAEIAGSATNRDMLRIHFNREGVITSSIKSDKMLEKLPEPVKEEVKKFDIYKEFTIGFSRIKPYQTLAINRGENLGILTVKLEKDDESYSLLGREVGIRASGNLVELEEALKKGYKALFDSLETELRGTLTEIAEDASIEAFKQNLANLLMSKPEYGEKVLGIDPGFRTGCKIVVLDALGNPVEFSKVYLHDLPMAEKILRALLEKHEPTIIAIGNGTASSETAELVQKITKTKIYIVNESGASVYSASSVAQEEFPELDVTDRGTISIARRYIDPLSELVKIPVGSIGVGMYQHDIAEKKLEEKLTDTVIDTVNLVGVNVNTASIYVLAHISGLDKRSAKKVYSHRPYKDRSALAKVLSAKSYEQAAGFLRIPDSKEAFDNTNIHPEQYVLAREIIEKNIESRDFAKYSDSLRKIYPDTQVSTVEFIRESYAGIGKDPRTLSTHMEVRPKKTLEELKEWDRMEWVVRNVVAFGAFVDIGMKNDGLVHISALADRFVKDPNDIVKVGQVVKVRVVKIDKDTGKIQLSMKEE